MFNLDVFNSALYVLACKVAFKIERNKREGLKISVIIKDKILPGPVESYQTNLNLWLTP